MQTLQHVGIGVADWRMLWFQPAAPRDRRSGFHVLG